MSVSENRQSGLPASARQTQLQLVSPTNQTIRTRSSSRMAEKAIVEGLTGMIDRLR